MSNLPYHPQPIQHETGANALLIDDDDARVEYMKRLGAKNMVPPLVRSTHLKIIANGRVLPWEELLAGQTELVLNCDANGNTDPEVWLPYVDREGVDPDEMNIAVLRAREVVLGQAVQMTNTHRAEGAINVTPRPMDYSAGVVSYADIEQLNAMLET